MEKLACPIQTQAIKNGENIAIFNQDKKISYFELEQGIKQLASKLSNRGVKKGDIVALRDNNSLALIQLIFATMRLGAIAFPVSYHFTEQELANYLVDVGVDFFWQSENHKKRITSLPIAIKPLLINDTERKRKRKRKITTTSPTNGNTALTDANPHDIAKLEQNKVVSLVFTSGSSGKPKAAAHSLENHYYSALGSASILPLTANSCWLASLPFYHIGGLAILFRCFFAGSSIALPGHKELVDTLTTLPITHASLVPTQLIKLLAQVSPAQANKLSLTHLLLGGAPISDALLAQTKKLNLEVFYSYGLTEMCSQVATQNYDVKQTDDKLKNSFYAPLPHREWKIDNDEIAVRGNTLFLGYMRAKNLEQPLIDGWFYTKDLAEHFSTNNQQNAIRIIGRKDNMFICGGENYQPEQVEQIISSHPQVEQTLIVPVDDDYFGKVAVAFVKTNKVLDNQELTTSLTEFLQARIAKIKIPKAFYPWPQQQVKSLKINRQRFIKLAEALRK